MAKGNDTELLIAHAYQAPVMLPEQTVSAETYEEWDRDLRNDVVERLQPLLGKARHRVSAPEGWFSRAFPIRRSPKPLKKATRTSS
jgi:hypothetical protein